MTAGYDRRIGRFQGVAAFGAALLVVGIVVAQEPEDAAAPLRFGDPETFEAPVEPVPTRPSPSPSTLTTTGSPAERVRAAIGSVRPGQPHEAAFAELLRIGDAGVPALIAAFENRNAAWESRWLAALALGRIGGTESVDALLRGLGDPLFTIRMAAAQALADPRDERVNPALRTALDDSAMLVQVEVVVTLGKRRDPNASTLLAEELHAERSFRRGRSLWIRGHILDALARIGDPQAVPAVRKVLEEDDPDLRRRAARTLEILAPTPPTDPVQ